MERPGQASEDTQQLPVRVVIDMSGLPELNDAAARVLLRILLRAHEKLAGEEQASIADSAAVGL